MLKKSRISGNFFVGGRVIHMAFFSDGEDRRKLLILYILKRSGIPLSREQLVLVLAENGVENYFDISGRMLELEENGYIASVPAFKLQLTVLTARGEEVVSLFDKNLPRSVRESMDACIDAHLGEFHRENTSRVITTPLPDGGFDATFALVEGGDAIFEIRVKLPSAKYAQLAERNWDSLGEELYLSTLMKLTREQNQS